MKTKLESLMEKALESLEQKYLDRTRNNVELVNKYGQKLNLKYPDHDKDKFNELLHGYKLWSKPNKTPEERVLLNKCTLTHIKQNEHHPEYWVNEDLSTFSRENPVCHEAYTMPPKAILEMCCDWCAMSEELNNTPFEWFAKVNGTRWKFSGEQQRLILFVLHKLWDNPQ